VNRKPAHPDLDELIGLFYRNPSQLGEFDEIEAEDMPEIPRRLLAHDEHMTVTVEAHHGGLVDVDVLSTVRQPPHYARKILLRRQTDGGAVLFGLMRVNLDFLESDVRDEILSQRTPLGRVLIEHNVLREVELVSLWRLTAGSDLALHLAVAPGQVVYGRTALIHCNAEPAIELLEVVP